MKGKTHDLNHDLTFSAHTINCMCHSIRSMFRVLGVYNFAFDQEFVKEIVNCQALGSTILLAGVKGYIVTKVPIQ